jgi:hypothetical protein
VYLFISFYTAWLFGHPVHLNTRCCPLTVLLHRVIPDSSIPFSRVVQANSQVFRPTGRQVPSTYIFLDNLPPRPAADLQDSDLSRQLGWCPASSIRSSCRRRAPQKLEGWRSDSMSVSLGIYTDTFSVSSIQTFMNPYSSSRLQVNSVIGVGLSLSYLIYTPPIPLTGYIAPCITPQILYCCCLLCCLCCLTIRFILVIHWHLCYYSYGQHSLMRGYIGSLLPGAEIQLSINSFLPFRWHAHKTRESCHSGV